MDLSRISLITNSNLQNLKDTDYLSNLIVKLGFNTEVLNEQPQIVKDNGGGLLIWQYPNQFSKYLALLQKYKIQSYIEIGCRWGGTFVLTNEYLKKFNHMVQSIAIDIIDSPVLKYCMQNKNTHFFRVNSSQPEFANYMQMNKFDLVFIDGDHSYEGVKNDYLISQNSGNIFVFHDIVNDVCPGVIQFWNELKTNEANKYDFFEFVEQYDEVFQSTNKQFLGIGVAIKKSFPFRK